MDIKDFEVWEEQIEGFALDAQRLASKYPRMVVVVDYEGPLFQIGFGGEAVKQSHVGEGDITAYEDAVDKLKPNHAVIKTLEAIVRQVDNSFIMQGSGINLIQPERLTYRDYPLLKFASLRCDEVLDRVVMKSKSNREVLGIKTPIPEDSLVVVVNDAEPGSSSHNAILREIKASNPRNFETYDVVNVIVPEYRREMGKASERYRIDTLDAFRKGFSSPVKARELNVNGSGAKSSFSPSDFYKLSPHLGNIRGE